VNELQQQEQSTLRMVRYLKRLSMEIETIKKQIKSGEIKIRKGKWTEAETEMGHGGDADTTSPLSTMYDKNLERQVVPTGKKLTGRPVVNIPDLKSIDLENIKIRIFSAEFPSDSAVVAYQGKPTLEDRFTLLIHIAALENNVSPSDLMDLHGITTDLLMGVLKKMIDPEQKDKRVASQFLSLAFQLKFPGPTKIARAEQNNYFNFSTKNEAKKAVKKQLEDIEGELEAEPGEDEQRGP